MFDIRLAIKHLIMHPNISIIPQNMKWNEITSYMSDLLMDVHEREILKLEPYEAGSTKNAKGLISRKMLQCNFFITTSGKKIMALYLTEIGRRYLSQSR